MFYISVKDKVARHVIDGRLSFLRLWFMRFADFFLKNFRKGTPQYMESNDIPKIGKSRFVLNFRQFRGFLPTDYNPFQKPNTKITVI
jgi:hypothetical protein